MPRCETTVWRGGLVCAHSVPKYEAWAEGTGPDFRLRILQGSWNPGVVKKSAGTHDGGGVVDVPGSADDTVNNMVRDAGRAAILVVMHRDDDEGWDPDHHHAIDPACPGLSTPAADQVREWLAGGDGLLGDKADRGSRRYVDEVRAQFAARSTPKPAPAPQEDVMATIAELRALLREELASVPREVWEFPLPHHDPNPNDDKPAGKSPARSHVVMANWRASTMQAPVAALLTLVHDLAASDTTLDAEVSAAVERALHDLRLVITKEDTP
jgi:hypothetical protein